MKLNNFEGYLTLDMALVCRLLSILPTANKRRSLQLEIETVKEGLEKLKDLAEQLELQIDMEEDKVLPPPATEAFKARQQHLAKLIYSLEKIKEDITTIEELLATPVDSSLLKTSPSPIAFPPHKLPIRPGKYTGGTKSYPVQKWSKTIIYSICEPVSYREGEVVFLPVEVAFALCFLRQAIDSPTPFSKLKQKLDCEVYSYLLEQLKLGQGWDWSDEVGSKDKEISPDDIPGFSEGVWPLWPRQFMLDWIPLWIQEKYGRKIISPLYGAYLHIEKAAKNQVVQALEQSGYQVTENDELVDAANGYGLYRSTVIRPEGDSEQHKIGAYSILRFLGENNYTRAYEAFNCLYSRSVGVLIVTLEGIHKGKAGYLYKAERALANLRHLGKLKLLKRVILTLVTILL